MSIISIFLDKIKILKDKHRSEDYLLYRDDKNKWMNWNIMNDYFVPKQEEMKSIVQPLRKQERKIDISLKGINLKKNKSKDINPIDNPIEYNPLGYNSIAFGYENMCSGSYSFSYQLVESNYEFPEETNKYHKSRIDGRIYYRDMHGTLIVINE